MADAVAAGESTRVADDGCDALFATVAACGIRRSPR
jgi:hypothetical protein